VSVLVAHRYHLLLLHHNIRIVLHLDTLFLWVSSALDLLHLLHLRHHHLHHHLLLQLQVATLQIALIS
jgi:hypothetical protein